MQLVGLYLVFAIAHRAAAGHAPHGPATGSLQRGHSALAGYAAGLLVSTAADLPSGPVIVWMLVALAVVVEATARQRLPSGWRPLVSTKVRPPG